MMATGGNYDGTGGHHDCLPPNAGKLPALQANGLHVDPRAVILFGRSLGSGPTVDLASRHPEVRDKHETGTGQGQARGRGQGAGMTQARGKGACIVNS